MDIKSLRAQFEAKTREAQALLSAEDLTAEDFARAKGLKSEADAIKSQIEQILEMGAVREALRGHDLWMNAPANLLPNRAAAGSLENVKPAGETLLERKSNGSLTHFYSDGECLLDEKHLAVICSNSYKQAWFEYVRKSGNFHLMSPTNVKVLSDGADTGGGFLVPEEVLAQILQKKPTPTRVRGFVTELSTGRDNLVIPKVNYTADDLYTTGIRVTWTEEIPSSATQARVNFPDSTSPATNGFGLVRVQIYTAMLSIPVTNDQLEDSMFPMATWIGGKFSETIDLLYDNMILNGSGVGQPSGILMNPGAGGQPTVVDCGSPITGDGLLQLAYTVPEQYEDGARWIFNKTNTANYIRRLKDENGRYLFGFGLQDSGLAFERPTHLAGYPFTYSGFMPNAMQSNGTSANAFAYPLIFGDPRGYYLVNRIGFSVQVLDQPYAELNQKVMLGRVRFGGQVGEEWRLKVGKVA